MSFSFWKKNTEMQETRPWGDFVVLSKDNNITIKKITVRPEKRLSYQSHQKRTEHWYIISGSGEIMINNTTFEAKAGQAFDIPVTAKHRVGNPNKETDLIFIEISTGEFDENDIVRYEDDFGRA